MSELTDDSKMPFGKHKGAPMSDVPTSYFHWLWTEGGKRLDKRCPVACYIRRNLDCLQIEYPDGIWE